MTESRAIATACLILGLLASVVMALTAQLSIRGNNKQNTVVLSLSSGSDDLTVSYIIRECVQCTVIVSFKTMKWTVLLMYKWTVIFRP